MSWDSTWEKVFRRSDWGQYPDVELVTFIARNFYSRARSSVRILELGCGTGANLWFFAREGFQAFGIDGSPTAIEKAGSRAKQESLSFNLKVGDINSIEHLFEHASFDAIIDVECLCCNNAESLERILSAAKQLLKPEGVLYSRTFGELMETGDSSPVSPSLPLEFEQIDEGPLQSLGFLRLSDRKAIQESYGRHFEISAIDECRLTRLNGSILVHEYIIQAKLAKSRQ